MKNLSYYIITASLLLSAFSCTTKTQPEQPNIILCMADDQGWGDINYNNHPVIKTPNLNKMASEALRFDHFYAAAPVCSPTRGSVLTGRHPNRFACYSWGNHLRPQENTLAELLKEKGYVTGHFGKWHLGSVQKGSPVNPGASGFDEWFSSPNFYDNDPILSREGIAEQTTGESSMIIVDEALKFIKKHKDSEKPYLAVVWFGSPHKPHKAAEQDKELYKDQPEKLQNFYGEITGMDRAIGKLRNELWSNKENENTILWYCSDNGGLKEIGSTGGRGYKSQIYEGGLRVPAIIEWPARIKKAIQTNFPSNTSDILPTIAEITGVDLPQDRPYDGLSLLSLIENPNQLRKQPMGFWQFPKIGVRSSSESVMSELLEAQRKGNIISDSGHLKLDASEIKFQLPVDSIPGHGAWLDWPWKLHRIERPKTGKLRFELYNLEEDPMEQNNLADKKTGKLSELKAQLENWQSSVVRSMNGEDYKN